MDRTISGAKGLLIVREPRPADRGEAVVEIPDQDHILEFLQTSQQDSDSMSALRQLLVIDSAPDISRLDDHEVLEQVAQQITLGCVQLVQPPAPAWADSSRSGETEPEKAPEPVKPKPAAAPVVEEKPKLITIDVQYVHEKSELQEVWDLTIDERPRESAAVFDVRTTPEGYNPVEYSAEVQGPKGVVRSQPGVIVEAGSPNRCTVRWDGADDDGQKAPVGSYKVQLTAKADGKSASAQSREIKIVRVGVIAIEFSDSCPLKFSFKNYPKDPATDDFDIPAAQWHLAALDDGDKPKNPPDCSATGRSADASTYCYPVAGVREQKLKIRIETAGKGYSAGDGIQTRAVKSGGDTAWSDGSAQSIGIGDKKELAANDANKLPDKVGKVDFRVDFIFERKDSKGKQVKLGRQNCSQLPVYVLVSNPEEPWGDGTKPERLRPWVELLEKACTDWGKDAGSETQALCLITEAVNGKLPLIYDTDHGADCIKLMVPGAAGGWFEGINLRDFLCYLAGIANPPPGGKDGGKLKVNCTCCGALVSTIANALGCSLNSSIMLAHFRCNKIIAIGTSDWHHPFYQHYDPADTVGAFSYHEVGWTGSSKAGDDIYDACLKVADDPTKPATNPKLPEGMTFATASKNVDDYRRRLVDPAHVPSVKPEEVGRRYKPQ